jgi:hypothetical protein
VHTSCPFRFTGLPAPPGSSSLSAGHVPVIRRELGLEAVVQGWGQQLGMGRGSRRYCAVITLK